MWRGNIERGVKKPGFSPDCGIISKNGKPQNKDTSVYRKHHDESSICEQGERGGLSKSGECTKLKKERVRGMKSQEVGLSKADEYPVPDETV